MRVLHDPGTQKAEPTGKRRNSGNTEDQKPPTSSSVGTRAGSDDPLLLPLAPAPSPTTPTAPCSSTLTATGDEERPPLEGAPSCPGAVVVVAVVAAAAAVDAFVVAVAVAGVPLLAGSCCIKHIRKTYQDVKQGSNAHVREGWARFDANETMRNGESRRERDSVVPVSTTSIAKKK